MNKKELTPKQKDRIVKHWQEHVDKEFEESKKRIALLENPVTAKVASELSHRLVQCCIDYINETGNTSIWRVNFTADCLQNSAKCGQYKIRVCLKSYENLVDIKFPFIVYTREDITPVYTKDILSENLVKFTILCVDKD